MNRDNLGDRMKSYEDTFRYYIPRKTNLILRLDGKAFHNFTRQFKKPFDDDLMEMMNKTTIKLCEEIQGAKLGFIQSDEISILITDYDDIQTSAWFDNNLQKIISVSASVATSEFNKYFITYSLKNSQKIGRETNIEAVEYYTLANFDSRAFIIPQIEEVANYFLWRCQDCSRNSIQMLARAHFSHKQCNNKNCSQLQDMLMTKNVNWNDLEPKYKRGRLIQKVKIPSSKKLNNGSIISFNRSIWAEQKLEDYNFDYWLKIVQNS